MQVDTNIWSALAWPLLKLLAGLSLGIFLANLLEALKWTTFLSYFSRPLARVAHLGQAASSAFTLAFLSPTQANAILAENYKQGKLNRQELILANLFNSFPAYLVHVPTIFCLTFPVLGQAALIYVGLSLLAALGRTVLTLIYARAVLPPQSQAERTEVNQPQAAAWPSILSKSWHRLLHRLPKLCLYTIPIYSLCFFLQTAGYFTSLKEYLVSLNLLDQFVSPQAYSIIAFHFLAELGSALAASGALLATGSLKQEEVILALLIGNILSTPLRAIRHQFPAYAGFYTPGLGLLLILLNQTLRAVSLIIITVIFVSLSSY